MDEEELVIGIYSTSLLDAQLTWPAKNPMTTSLYQ